MITPLDIQNKEFGKSVRGYKEEDVDGFLDLLTVDMEKLITENKSQKEEIERLKGELERYIAAESSVVETLESAKALMRDISASSEKRAEILLKNAQLDAELIQRGAKESVERLTDESASLRNRFNTFQARYKSLLETELERFDSLTSTIIADFGMEDLKTFADAEVEQKASNHGRKFAEPNGGTVNLSEFDEVGKDFPFDEEASASKKTMILNLK